MQHWKHTRRRFLLGSVRNAVNASVSSIPVLYFLKSQPNVGAQTSNALAIPEAVVTPDLSTGEWLPGEFGTDSLELKGVPSMGAWCEMNCPPTTLLPYLKLNHDANNLYALSDLTRETILTNDIATVFGFDTANDGGSKLTGLDDFLIYFLLKGSGSSPSNYKLQITNYSDVPYLDQVKGNWSFASSMHNSQKHVIMKLAVPISSLTKYRPGSDVNGIFGFETNLGNLVTEYAAWPTRLTGNASWGELYLSGDTAVDYFPPGMEGPTLAASLFMATMGFAAFKRFSERKSGLSKKKVSSN